MKRLFICIALLRAFAIAGDTMGRGPGGGGHGGGGGGRGFSGGGGSRGFSGGGHTPSFSGGSRPSMSNARPSSRPSYIPQSRPATAATRPASQNRPNFNPNNRPSWASNDRPNNTRPTIANRPDIDRPGFNGGGEQWNRPNGNGNRPDWNVNNRPHIGDNNFNNINVNRNWNNNINRWANNRPNNGWNRPWYNHYDHWHYGWHHGYWNYWGGGNYPWAWFGAGAALGWWASPGASYVYENPYYVVPVDSTAYYPDYSQPIPPPTEEAPLAGEPAPGDVAADVAGGGSSEEDPNTQKAIAIFDAGRELFKTGNYQGALDKVNQAIQLLPSDATLHEFRALCLFALKQYKEAAAGVYAVLAGGPGWDWDTMRALYPDANVYTAQLRELEEYQKTHPDATDASFLLAYHYLVMGYPDQATKELDRVVKAQPDDKLASALLQALKQRKQGSPAPESPPAVGVNATQPKRLQAA